MNPPVNRDESVLRLCVELGLIGADQAALVFQQRGAGVDSGETVEQWMLRAGLLRPDQVQHLHQVARDRMSPGGSPIRPGSGSGSGVASPASGPPLVAPPMSTRGSGSSLGSGPGSGPGSGLRHSGTSGSKGRTGARRGGRLQEGELIGGHQIVKELARGGMGAVYLARRVSDLREVALKVMLAGEDADEREIERFRREIDANRELAHPHVVELLDSGREDRLLYYTMELLEGGSLDQLAGDDRLSVESRVALMEKVARAVGYAHGKGVIHRGLKPQNVMLTAEGEPKVTDFGLARSLFNQDRLTKSGATLGTPKYMAPEQVRGETRTTDQRCDVWALGVMLYELLSGQLPFAADELPQLYHKILHEPPRVNLKELVPDATGGLVSVIDRCLEKTPADRYRDADELADDLREWLETGLVRVHGQSASSRVWRGLARRSPKVWAPMLVGLLVLVGAPGIVAWRRSEQRRAKREERRRRFERAEVVTGKQSKVIRTLLAEIAEARRANDLGLVDRELDKARKAAAMLDKAESAVDPADRERFLKLAVVAEAQSARKRLEVELATGEREAAGGFKERHAALKRLRAARLRPGEAPGLELELARCELACGAHLAAARRLEALAKADGEAAGPPIELRLRALRLAREIGAARALAARHRSRREPELRLELLRLDIVGDAGGVLEAWDALEATTPAQDTARLAVGARLIRRLPEVLERAPAALKLSPAADLSLAVAAADAWLGLPEDAERALRPLEGQRPGLTRMRRAELAVFRGDFAAADVLLAEAAEDAERDPAAAMAALRLRHGLRQAGLIEGAAALILEDAGRLATAYDDVDAVRHGWLELRVGEAIRAAVTGLPPTELALSTEAERDDPGLLAAELILRGFAGRSSEDQARADELLTELGRRDPQHPLRLYARARLVEAGRRDRLEDGDAVQKAIEAARRLGRLRSTLDARLSRSAEVHLRRFQDSRRADDQARATQLLALTVAVAPWRLHDATELLRRRRTSGDSPALEAEARALLALTPGDPEARGLAALILAESGEDEEARAALEQGPLGPVAIGAVELTDELRRDSSSRRRECPQPGAAARHAAALLHERAGRTEAALQAADAGLRLHPRRLALRELRARLLTKLGRTAEAKRERELTAHMQDPKHIRAHELREASTDVRYTDLEASMRLARRGLLLAPRYASVLSALAQAEIVQKDERGQRDGFTTFALTYYYDPTAIEDQTNPADAFFKRMRTGPFLESIERRWRSGEAVTARELWFAALDGFFGVELTRRIAKIGVALRRLRRLLCVAPESWAARALIGFMRVLQADAGGRSDLELARRYSPRATWVLLPLGILAARGKAYDQVMTIFREAAHPVYLLEKAEKYPELAPLRGRPEWTALKGGESPGSGK